MLKEGYQGPFGEITRSKGQSRDDKRNGSPSIMRIFLPTFSNVKHSRDKKKKAFDIL